MCVMFQESAYHSEFMYIEPDLRHNQYRWTLRKSWSPNLRPGSLSFTVAVCCIINHIDGSTDSDLPAAKGAYDLLTTFRAQKIL